MKKYIALIVALFLTLTVLSVIMRDNSDTEPSQTASQQETTEEETTEAKGLSEVTLGYYENKSLNPYTTDSPVNRNLSTLLYDGLYMLDEKYMPQPVIAESSERTTNRLSVTLKKDIYFSSGSPLTASDVAYSFNIAKTSPYYSMRLEDFTAAAAGTDSVIFTTVSDNPYAESCLTFPVIQAGTATNEYPVGSGRYVLQSNNNTKFLAVNENSVRSELMNTERIVLTPITSDKSELYLLQTGDLTYFFDDLSEGRYTKIGANMQRVPLNNLVFLGINSNSAMMQDKALIKAISLSIDKTTISESAYSGMCRATDTPFNPDWHAVSVLQAQQSSFSSLKAAQALEDAGYVYAYSNNKYRSKDFRFLEVRMIVNEENENRVNCANLIHDSLEDLGFDVRLSILPFEDYSEALYKGEFDLYLGEVKLSANMDLSCFFKEGGSAGYGIDSSSTVALSYSDFSQGKIDITTFTKVFSDSLPFIPICYRDGVAYYSREITFEGEITEYEPFMNIYSWELKSNTVDTEED